MDKKKQQPPTRPTKDVVRSIRGKRVTSADEHPIARLMFKNPDGTVHQMTWHSSWIPDDDTLGKAVAALNGVPILEAMGCELLYVERLSQHGIEL